MPNRQIPKTEMARRYQYENGSFTEIAAESGEDTDTTTAFSWNPTGLTDYHRLYLKTNIKEESNAANDVTLTVNGLSSSYRYQLTKDDTQTTSQSEWLLCTLASDYAAGLDVLLLGGLPPVDFVRPAFEMLGAAYRGNAVAEGGDVNSKEDAITSLTLSTAGNATGTAVLIGEKL